MLNDLSPKEQQQLFEEVTALIIEDEKSKLNQEKNKIIEDYKLNVEKLSDLITKKENELEDINTIFNNEYKKRIDNLIGAEKFVYDKENIAEKNRKETASILESVKKDILDFENERKVFESMKADAVKDIVLREENINKLSFSIDEQLIDIKNRELNLSSKEEALVNLENIIELRIKNIEKQQEKINIDKINLEDIGLSLNKDRSEVDNLKKQLILEQDNINNQLSNIKNMNEDLLKKSASIDIQIEDLDKKLLRNQSELSLIGNQIAKNNSILVLLKNKEIDLNNKERELKERENNVRLLEEKIAK